MAQNSVKTVKRGPGRKFQPGVSGNPGGRPSSRPYKEALEAAVRHIHHIVGFGDDSEE